LPHKKQPVSAGIDQDFLLNILPFLKLIDFLRTES